MDNNTYIMYRLRYQYYLLRCKQRNIPPNPFLEWVENILTFEYHDTLSAMKRNFAIDCVKFDSE